MSLYDIIVALVIGAVAGWLAGIIMGTKGGLIRNIILGIIGGFVGRFIFSFFHLSISLVLGPINFTPIIVSAIGACIVILIVNLLFK